MYGTIDSFQSIISIGSPILGVFSDGGTGFLCYTSNGVFSLDLTRQQRTKVYGPRSGYTIIYANWVYELQNVVIVCQKNSSPYYVEV